MITGTGSSFTRHSMREVVHGDSPVKGGVKGNHRDGVEGDQ
jgi:hypothetical protein